MRTEMQCDGDCSCHGDCMGPVRRVSVVGYVSPRDPRHRWTFNYCDIAVEKDKANGFEVIELDREAP